MKKLILLSVLCVLVSCKGKKSPVEVTTNPKNFEVERLAQSNSTDALQKNYPDANLKEGVGLFEEGTVERAYTILYSDTKNEIHIIWETPERKNVYQVYFSGDGDWVSNKSIRIGTTYEELVNQNGKPINVYGFGWDYSGAVDWNGGKLENSKLQVFMKPSTTPKPKFYGDGIITPNEAELKELNLTVGQIIYHLGNE